MPNPTDPYTYDDEYEIDPELERKAGGCLWTVIAAGGLTLVGALAWIGLKWGSA